MNNPTVPDQQAHADLEPVLRAFSKGDLYFDREKGAYLRLHLQNPPSDSYGLRVLLDVLGREMGVDLKARVSAGGLSAKFGEKANVMMVGFNYGPNEADHIEKVFLELDQDLLRYCGVRQVEAGDAVFRPQMAPALVRS
jgi:hypothetical protein